jgi:hypothetical protein
MMILKNIEPLLASYLTSIRPDIITFLVQQVSKFLNSPTSAHFKAAHNVLRYLKGNLGTSLFFSHSSSLDILGFSDVDRGGFSDSIGGSSHDIASSLAKL